jgi:hypothetical protein
LRKVFYSLISLISILLWGAIVLTFGIVYGNTLDHLPFPEKINLAKYGMVMCVFMFHFTWAWSTLGQVPLAFAMNDEIGHNYLTMIKQKYRISLLFTFVDLIYFAFFVIKFWSVLHK